MTLCFIHEQQILFTFKVQNMQSIIYIILILLHILIKNTHIKYLYLFHKVLEIHIFNIYTIIKTSQIHFSRDICSKWFVIRYLKWTLWVLIISPLKKLNTLLSLKYSLIDSFLMFLSLLCYSTRIQSKYFDTQTFLPSLSVH